MSPDIVLSKTEDEAVKEALIRILSNTYKRDVRITGFAKEEIRSWEHSDVFRLYLRIVPVPSLRSRAGPDEGDSCDEMTVILKQFNPNVNDENIIVLYEALGRILSGKRIAPEFYGTICDVEKRRYWLFMEDHWAVRAAIARALGERGNPGAAKLLIPALQDPVSSVRENARML